MLRSMPYTQGWHNTRRKPSGKIEARWADENGEARGKCFLTESQAKRYAFNQAKAVLDGAMGFAVPTKDIRAAATDFISRYTDPGTLSIIERHINNFLDDNPTLKTTGQLTKDLMIAYDALLAAKRKKNGKPSHNPGGRKHILKDIKTFTRYCMEKNYLKVDPFFKFAMPQSDFEGRPLNPDEYAKMITIDPGHEEGDIWISRALRIGNPSILRISQVWKLTPENFRLPDLLYVEGIKGQDPEWKPLHPIALAAIKELLAITPPGQRFFRHWNTMDAMRKQLRRKADRVGLHGVRFHDAGKVTRISELDAQGYGLAKLAILSNTSRATLAKHYIKADRRAAYAEYQTYGGPTEGGKTGQNTAQGALDGTRQDSENGPRISEI